MTSRKARKPSARILEKRRQVRHDDGRFHFVAVLAAGTAATRANKLAILQQIVDRDGCRMVFRSRYHRFSRLLC